MYSIDQFSDSKQKYFYTFQTGQYTNLKVVSFSLEEEISQPFIARIVIASERYNFDYGEFLDVNGLLTLYRNGEVQRYLHGVITSIEKSDRKNRYYLYTITLEPRIFRLGLRKNVRIFQHQTIQEIVTTLLKESGIFYYDWNLKAQYTPREYCVQYRETDLEFIDRLLAEEGLSYYFHHLKDRHTIIIYDHYTGTMRLDRTIPYHLPQGGAHPEESIYSLSYREKIGFSSVKLTDYCFKKSNYTLVENSIFKFDSGQRNHYFYYDYPGRYKSEENGERYSRKKLAELRKALNRAFIKSDILELEAGYSFTLSAHIDDSFNKEWLIAKIKHTGTQYQVLEEEGIVAETLYYNEALLVDTKTEWFSKGNPKPQIDGSQIGVVVGPEGEEVFCDEYGRVRVKFPWDIHRMPEPMDDSGFSCWIRVAQNWAGKGWGSVQLPRIGQEVIVSFLNGDPDQPIITGRVYNDQQVLPYKLPYYKTITTIKSKEHHGDGYNELVLDDTQKRIKAMLHTTHGASQLSLGYIKSEYKVNQNPEHRGDGFELRTDEWGAIRAGKGLYISADVRGKATGKQLDIDEAIFQLQHALKIATSLANASKEASVFPTVNNDKQKSQLKTAFTDVKQPTIIASAPDGIALTSPENIQISSQSDVVLTSEDSVNISTYSDFRVASKEAISLFGVEKDVSIIANKGRIKIQAQHDELEVIANKRIQVLSTDDEIIIAGEKGLILTAQGASIELKDGNITLKAPGVIEHKGSGFPFNGPEKYNFDMPGFKPVSVCIECLKRAAKLGRGTVELV